MISASEQENVELMQWVYNNTNFPTFAEFSKDPDKWRKNEEDLFDCIAQMNVFFKERVNNVTYRWRGKYKCKTLEELQKITRNEGYKGTDLEMVPVVKPTDGTSNLYNSKMHVTIDVYSKTEARLMGRIVAND